jgi:hypothetical protein
MGLGNGIAVGELVVSILEDLAEANPNALLLEGFEAAMVGVTVGHWRPAAAVYDVDLLVEIQASRSGASHREADAFVASEVIGAYAGENSPLYVRLAK